MDIPDYKLKQNRGYSEFSSAKRGVQAKRKGNERRIPKLVKACDDAIEAIQKIREGAIEEAENHIGDLGTSSSLYTWLYGVEPGDIVELVDPFDERLKGEEGEVFDTYEEDGEEIAMVYLYDVPHKKNRDIPSRRLEVKETDREVSDSVDYSEFEEDETVRVTAEGEYEGATGFVVDSEKWKSDTYYLVHIFEPHDVMKEFSADQIVSDSE